MRVFKSVFEMVLLWALMAGLTFLVMGYALFSMPFTMFIVGLAVITTHDVWKHYLPWNR